MRDLEVRKYVVFGMNDQSVDESITCDEGVHEEAGDELRYYVHNLYCNNWSCVQRCSYNAVKSRYRKTRTAILSFLLSLGIHDLNCTAARNVHFSLTIITVISDFYP